MAYQLNRLAFHFVDKKTSRLEPSAQEEVVGNLDPEITKFMLDRVTDLRDADESGSTSAARFASESGHTAGPPITKECIGRIIKDASKFFETSKLLAQHLYDQSPGQASPGLIAIMRLEDSANQSVSVAILKISHRDEAFIRSLATAPTNLRVEHLKGLLDKKVQKGVICPHPDRSEYDLKVIDLQATDDPAQYFTKFLGCWTKKSDEHQIKNLIPAVIEYGKARGLSVNKAKLPSVIQALQVRDISVTTPAIGNILNAQGVLGADFDSADFVQAMEQGDVGAVDIPFQGFVRSGKSKSIPRQITFSFRDPKYRKLRISGPPELFEQIISVQHDSVTFRVQTTQDGFDVKYE